MTITRVITAFWIIFSVENKEMLSPLAGSSSLSGLMIMISLRNKLNCPKPLLWAQLTFTSNEMRKLINLTILLLVVAFKTLCLVQWLTCRFYRAVDHFSLPKTIFLLWARGPLLPLSTIQLVGLCCHVPVTSHEKIAALKEKQGMHCLSVKYIKKIRFLVVIDN